MWIEEFEKFLDMLVEDNDKLWIAGYTQVYKYLVESSHTTLNVTKLDNNTYRINMADTLDDTLYNEPLTLSISVDNSWDKCSFVGISQSCQITNNRILVNVKPDTSFTITKN